MKYWLCGLLVIILNNPLDVFGDEHEGFIINGKIGGLKEGEKIVMTLFGQPWADWVQMRQDSAFVTNEGFSLKGSVPFGPRLYRLSFDKHVHHYIFFYIDNGETITIHSPDIEKVKTGRIQYEVNLSGGETERGVEQLDDAGYLFSQTISRLNKEMDKLKDSIGFNAELVGQLMLAKRNLIDAFNYANLQPNINNKGLAPVLNSYNGRINHAYFLSDLYQKLEEKTKNTFYGKLLKERAALSEGQQFPDFAIPDIRGKLIYSKEVISKSKVTLVHFWASNSFERGKCQDELRSIYKLYHGKGLNIIGVSSDTSSKEWRIRVQLEEYPWLNVSDLKGKEGVVEKVYHECNTNNVPGINNTTNVLIASDGKILSWDVVGPELQWYLWKHLEK